MIAPAVFDLLSKSGSERKERLWSFGEFHGFGGVLCRIGAHEPRDTDSTEDCSSCPGRGWLPFESDAGKAHPTA
jgi:hypothetical protein